MLKSTLKIAHLGLKGIPARYGGIEAYVENISRELVSRGHDVTVYSRKWYTKYDSSTFQGISIRHTPTFNFRPLDSLIHGLTSFIDILFKDYDIVHFHGYISYLFIPGLKLLKRKTKVVITFHGQVWLYEKYNWFQKSIIKIFATGIGVRFSDIITTVSPDIVKLYGHKKAIHFTPVGIKPKEGVKANLIKSLGVNSKGYILFLGVLERNKRVDWIIEAFSNINTDLKCVIAGDTPDKRYKRYLLDLAKGNDHIIFTGFVAGQLKEELLSNCILFILPSDIEGMPVAIMEAVGYGRPCLVRDNISFKGIFREGETGFFCSNKNGLYSRLYELLNSPKEYLEIIGLNAKKQLSVEYTYSHIVNILEDLYRR